MIFLCYSKCSTCKKAKKWLDENKIKYISRDIKEENPKKKEIMLWHENSNLPIKRFFNTSGIIYREKNLKDKLEKMSDEKKYSLLATDGMLVKRPMIIDENNILIGFNQEKWTKYFGS